MNATQQLLYFINQFTATRRKADLLIFSQGVGAWPGVINKRRHFCYKDRMKASRKRKIWKNITFSWQKKTFLGGWIFFWGGWS